MTEVNIPEIELHNKIPTLPEQSSRFNWLEDAFFVPNSDASKSFFKEMMKRRLRDYIARVDVVKGINKMVVRSKENEVILGSAAANIEAIVRQNIQRYPDSKSKMKLLEIGQQDHQVELNLIPLTPGDQLGGVEVRKKNGEVRQFKYVRPSSLDSASRQGLIANIREQARQIQGNAVQEINEKPRWERWIEKISSDTQEVLWLPVDPEQNGRILVDSPSLKSYLRGECFSGIGQDQAQRIAQKYGKLDVAWDQIMISGGNAEEEVQKLEKLKNVTPDVYSRAGIENSGKPHENGDSAEVISWPNGVDIAILFDAASSVQNTDFNRALISAFKDRRNHGKNPQYIIQEVQAEFRNNTNDSAAGAIVVAKVEKANANGERRYSILANGDVRAYSVDHNNPDKSCFQITTDQNDKLKPNRLTRAVKEDDLPNVIRYSGTLMPGHDLILVCDGAHGRRSESDFGRLYKKAVKRDSVHPAQALVNLAYDEAERSYTYHKNRGSKKAHIDDCTAAIIRN